MLRFRYDISGKWYKGNTHLHTTASDGGKTRAEVAALYAGASYDFLYATDHWVMSDAAQDADQAPLMWLDGVELDGKDEAGNYYHIVCLGKVIGISRELSFVDAVAAARDQGAMLVLAHPFWTGNSFEDTGHFPFDGVEVYNHVCQWLNGKGESRPYWEQMLLRDTNKLAFASDDAHLRVSHPGWDGGWIVVNAPELSAAAVTDAIRAGNFYSSCGPQFLKIEHDGAKVRVETSPVQFARLVGPAYRGSRVGSFEDQQMSEATFTVPADWPYAIIEIEDRFGRRAWTNTLFVERT